MSIRTIHMKFVCAVATMLAAAMVMAAAPELPMEEHQGPAGLAWSPEFRYDGATLKVGGPTGLVLKRDFAPGELLAYGLVDGIGMPLPDGDYSWQVVVRRSLRAVEIQEVEEAKKEAMRLRAQAMKARGSLDGGSASAAPGPEMEAQEAPVKMRAVDADQLAAQAEEYTEFVERSLEERFGPFVVTRSGTFQIVDGKTIYPPSFDDAGGQADADLPADDSSLKYVTESSVDPGHWYDDTQDEDCTPAYDWKIEAQGGVSNTDVNNYYRLVGVGELASGNCASDVEIFRFSHDGGASSISDSINSIVVSSNGDISLASNSFKFDRSVNYFGIGETVPLDELHIQSTSPAIRLEDSSDGTIASFDYNAGILALEGNSSQDIFSIRGIAPANSVVVAADGGVGFGGSTDTAPSWVSAGIFSPSSNTDLHFENPAGDWVVLEQYTNYFTTCLTPVGGGAHTCPSWIERGAPRGLLNLTPTGVGITDTGVLFTPAATLHVKKPTGVGGATLLVQEGALEIQRTDGASANFRYRVINPTISQDWLFMLNGTNGKLEFRNATAGASPFTLRPEAPTNSVFVAQRGVGIRNGAPSYPLHMGSGAHVTVGGVWTNASSRALKDGISDLSAEAAKSALEGLQPVTFHYKNSPDEQYAGFIAEDVPEVVATNDRQGLSPMDLVAVLTKVVQDQQNTIENLATRIEELESQ